jgi:hypothetical protein
MLSSRADAGEKFAQRLRPYKNNYAAIGKTALARRATRSGWGVLDDHDRQKKVVVLKSDSHLSQDTKSPEDETPERGLRKQIIDEVQPKLVITTGTAGGIGKQFEVGDVIVSPNVRFDCQKWLKTPFHDADYRGSALQAKYLAKAQALFKRMPTSCEGKYAAAESCGVSVPRNRWSPPISSASTPPTTITSSGALVTFPKWAMPCWKLRNADGSAPRWIAMRNADPQIKRKARSETRPRWQRRFKGIWSLELGVQRDCMLGADKCGVSAQVLHRPDCKAPPERPHRKSDGYCSGWSRFRVEQQPLPIGRIGLPPEECRAALPKAPPSAS